MVYIDSPWLYRPSHTHVCTYPHRYTHVHTCAHSVTCPVLLLMILPLLGTASPTWCSGKPLEDSASMASSPGTFPGSFRLFPGPLPCSEFPKQHSVLTPTHDSPASCHNYPPAQVASPPDCELLENQGSVLCVLVSPSQDMVLSPLQMVVKWLNGRISLLGSGDARIVSQTILQNIT